MLLLPIYPDMVVQAQTMMASSSQNFVARSNKGLSGQRGDHFPPPPRNNMRQI